MKIGFIVSPGRQNLKPFRSQPLNVLYLLTILEQEFKDKVDLELIELRGVNIDDAIYHIPEKDAYLHSIGDQDYPDTKRIIKEIRNIYPRAKHIGGGPHVNIFKEQTLETFDAIGIGEGEETIKRIVNDLLVNKLDKVYRKQEDIDINQYPYPLRKFLARSSAAEKNVLTSRHRDILGTDVVFSRGCPYDCSFCCNLMRGPVRMRSPKNIYEEIMYLKKEYGVGGIVIKDDQAIPTNRSIAIPTLETIARTDIKWRGQSRANGITPDVVKLARESGCLEIAIGIESVSQRVLEINSKKIDLDKAKEYFACLKKEGINIKLLLIIGLPGEPKNIADLTINFVKEVQPTNVFLTVLTPMPGSELYINAKNYGIKIDPQKEFDQYKFLWGRFDPTEKPKLIFEYEKETPFGEGMSVEEISDNYVKVQTYLRDNNFNF